MATTEAPSRPPHDRHGRRRPFANWMKRLANLKNSSSTQANNVDSSSSKRNGTTSTSKSKKGANKNNPYPLSGNGHLSFSESAPSERHTHASRSEPSLIESSYEQQPFQSTAPRSAAPTLSTNAETTISDAAHSKAGTSTTAGGATHGGGEGSTFSSPAPSVRSLTTTLTTVQSAAPSNQIYYNLAGGAHHNHNNYSPPSSLQPGANQQNNVQFSHQFPTSPAPALPLHLSPQPTTYSSATANNLLTDNASVLTLASSSKRRRRNSLDTNASVRALAPSSLFSGSRESLPLSILSGTIGSTQAGGPSGATAGAGEQSSITNAPGVLNRNAVAAAAERSSIYSAVPGDRNSFSPMRPPTTDAGSVRSGRISHHARDGSATGSLNGVAIVVASPGAAPSAGRISRRSSGWGEVPPPEADDHEERENCDGSPSLRLEGGESAKANGKA
ncbi:hypothetical protein AJ80_02954 [Polytolypa hystricis UAMH7299]|uniref:Ca2+-modulated nonselective cation channel polycystin n=1 Tax=Polytolypa hystricis (strain UAMH7299) TaxID=1447883 RepID=A0A2B7YNM6_POLH7|nr:hypothetical protein AJ80_02954 [Polytolypa hystricis UAMH7299]